MNPLLTSPPPGTARPSEIRAWVRDYYGRTLTHSEDLMTNACCASAEPAAWLKDLLSNVHDDVHARFYGCGYPIPDAIGGRTLLDLGCGSGRDVYVLSQMVGRDGVVHGVDMTDAQLEVARLTEDWHRRRFGYPASNVRFHTGYIEDLQSLDIPEASVDVVVSNCVVNLSPLKDVVLAEIFRVLKPGGEFYFSDVFADRRLPPELVFDPILHSECLGGAMYRTDFESLAHRTGFHDPRVMTDAPISIENEEIERKVGAAAFTSVTYRLLKVEGLDEQCEDYGQVATYTGGVANRASLFWLDDHHAFEVGRPERVCRNTAVMLTDTRFAPYFDVSRPSTHFGEYPCGPTMAAQKYGEIRDGEVCGPGGCC